MATEAICCRPVAGRPYGQGLYRRRIELMGDGRRVVADLEDDFHRFRLWLEHDGRRVIALRSDSLRYPWTECPGAARPLRALEGMPLSERSTAVGSHAESRSNCTHLFDLAGLAVAHATRGPSTRRYDLTVPDRDPEARTQPQLERDGATLLSWQIEASRILAPEPYAGLELRGRGLIAWTDSHLDADQAEAAVLLRRACFISLGRAEDLDRAEHAGVFMPLTAGTCHTFTPGLAEGALRMRGTSLDFSDRPEALLADLREREA